MYHLKSTSADTVIRNIRARLAMTAPTEYQYSGPPVRVQDQLLRTGASVGVSALTNTVIINAKALELSEQDYRTLTARLRRPRNG